jgi:hypothetical protein
MPNVRFVTGYYCPTCRFERRGLERYGAARQVTGWDFKVPESLVTIVQCGQCDTVIERKHWRFYDADGG